MKGNNFSRGVLTTELSRSRESGGGGGGNNGSRKETTQTRGGLLPVQWREREGGEREGRSWLVLWLHIGAGNVAPT